MTRFPPYSVALCFWVTDYKCAVAFMAGFTLALEECMQHPVLQRQNKISPWTSKTLLHARASLQVRKQCSSPPFLSLWSSFLQFQTSLLPVCVLTDHLGALLPSQADLSHTQVFLFCSGVLCVCYEQCPHHCDLPGDSLSLSNPVLVTSSSDQRGTSIHNELSSLQAPDVFH